MGITADILAIYHYYAVMPVHIAIKKIALKLKGLKFSTSQKKGGRK